MSKTPLQKWAWDRFMLKGFLASTRSRLLGLARADNVAPTEAFRLGEIAGILSRIRSEWDDNHKLTRDRAKEEKSGV